VRKWAEGADLKKWAALIAVAALAVALTLGSVIILVDVTIRISHVENPAMRAIATATELFTGMLWLIGTIYISTRLAVLIFSSPISAPENQTSNRCE
jgi:hypothetical protein